jgi:murein DD-endopeptidase MepM/ murein hydrolase activator NlpD
MNVNIRQKLAGKSAYIALGLLMALIVFFTVIAIIAAVNEKDEAPLPPSVDNNGEGAEPDVPSGTEPDDIPTDGEPTEPDEPSGDDISEPETPVYVSPCEGAIQKDYSEDVLVFSQTMNDHRIHLGVDISGKVGDPVKAFAGGTVERIYNDNFMGKTVVIDHGNGLKSLYMNLATEIPEGIKEGSSVAAGTVIGAIGESAISECADSPHLHFEIRLNNKRIDPKNHVTLPSSSVSDEFYEG